MRLESSVTSVSWIPSESITGPPKLPFFVGTTHFDRPPPDRLWPPLSSSLDQLRSGDRLRFANHLSAWAEIADGEIVACGYNDESGGIIGRTTVRLGASVELDGVPFEDRRADPHLTGRSVRFRQSAGGRSGIPAPRRVSHPPFVQVIAPIVWTTLELTLDVDGTTDGRLVGASPFPRHWIYDSAGEVVSKSGLIDFKRWYRGSFGTHSPWGDEDAEAFTTDVESALERLLSLVIMGGDSAIDIRRLEAGELLFRQGEPGRVLALLIDGILRVEVDGRDLGQLGPGVIIGERASLESGRRTATLQALTKCKVALVAPEELQPSALEQLRELHRREEETPGDHRDDGGGSHHG